jgi:hypothetical protein
LDVIQCHSFKTLMSVHLADATRLNSTRALLQKFASAVQKRPVNAVQSAAPHAHCAEFAAEPSVIEQAEGRLHVLVEAVHHAPAWTLVQTLLLPHWHGRMAFAEEPSEDRQDGFFRH